ncbi:hypothetical protein chiPu_0026911 [Chiloscyllium punctatum]|uniref:Uncharacterized protein n=1 Tax=Chiloscyllium punctatum TaxID=137246 RepID=A0A401TK51_CHIPU|nr:hypothetical protein [Chiloscyllium punctatum]
MSFRTSPARSVSAADPANLISGTAAYCVGKVVEIMFSLERWWWGGGGRNTPTGAVEGGRLQPLLPSSALVRAPPSLGDGPAPDPGAIFVRGSSASPEASNSNRRGRRLDPDQPLRILPRTISGSGGGGPMWPRGRVRVVLLQQGPCH